MKPSMIKPMARLGKLGLAACILWPSLLVANAILTIKGTIFSVLKDQYVIQSGHELYHLQKNALAPDQRKKIETAGAHEIAVDVPMEAILRVRTTKETPAKELH